MESEDAESVDAWACRRAGLPADGDVDKAHSANLEHYACRGLFRARGWVPAAALCTRVIGLERMLLDVRADVYFGHNIDTLAPVCRAAKRRGALVGFDCMEFHSDMGETQNALDRRLIRALEERWLGSCALVLASSDSVADELVKEYGIPRPLPLYNVPERQESLPPKEGNGLSLYWRNSVIGLGQRGLEDALLALGRLPDAVVLHLQGRLPTDGGRGLRAKIKALQLAHRVVIHPPHAPEEAVNHAARYHVGLCLERRGNRNHECTARG